jgi:hypothetical protein
MKTVLILAVASLCCGAGLAQSPQGASQASPCSNPEETVAVLLADNGRAPIPGFFQKRVVGLGDAAAVGIIQFLGDRKATVSKDSTSTEEIRRVLLIIQIAFEAPNAIQCSENRYPKATLVLLKYLSSLPTAGPVQDDLRGTAEMIEKLKATLKPSK